MTRSILLPGGLLLACALSAVTGLLVLRHRQDLENLEHRVRRLEAGSPGAAAEEPVGGSDRPVRPPSNPADDLVRRVVALEESAASAREEAASRRDPAGLMARLKGLSKSRVMMTLRDLINEGDTATLAAMLARGEDVDYAGGAVINQDSVDIPPSLRVALLDALNKIGSEESRRELLRFLRDSRIAEETNYCLMFLLRSDGEHPEFQEALVSKAKELLPLAMESALSERHPRISGYLLESCGRHQIPEALPLFVAMGKAGCFDYDAEKALERYPEEARVQVLDSLLGDPDLPESQLRLFLGRSTSLIQGIRVQRPRILERLRQLEERCSPDNRHYFQYLRKALESSN